MYKIKVFHNMSGLVAGHSLKEMFSNKDWWKGMFSNILSTMIGIVLTIGVAALVEYHNDKKLSKEMMFQVIKTCDDNRLTILSYDTMFTDHRKALASIMNLYLEKNKDIYKIPSDSLDKYINILFHYHVEEEDRTHVDTYFFSAQMMHQFGNPNKYSEFTRFVKEDQEVFKKIEALDKQREELQETYYSYLYDDPDCKDGIDAMQKMIKEHILTNYYYGIRSIRLNYEAAYYQYEYKRLLKVAGATEDEYKEYKESTRLSETKGESFEYSGDGMKTMQKDDDR